MREVIIGDMNQYKLKEDGTFYSLVIKTGRGGAILGNEWIKKEPYFNKCDYRGGGYYRISLKLDGQTTHRLHRLVARFFVSGYDEKLSVNHIDGNRSNNHARNLEWVSHIDNMKNASDRGVFKKINKLRGKLKKENVIELAEMINRGDRNKYIAEYFNIDPSTVSKIRNKKHNSHNDFHCLIN